jgi:opacity protein-like surface antigen
MKAITSKALVFNMLAAITLSPTTNAQQHVPKTGFYIGAALGGADLTAKNNLILSRTFIVGGAPATRNLYVTSTDKNITGEVFGGYEIKSSCFWLAGEVVGSFTPLTSNTRLDIFANNSPIEIKTTGAVGGAFKLGYYFNPTSKFYLKMGIEFRRFKVNAIDSSSRFIGLTQSYNSTAFVPGLGMEIDLTSHFSLRAEYRIALHPQKTLQNTNGAAQSTLIRHKPTIHYLNLGLVFKI